MTSELLLSQIDSLLTTLAAVQRLRRFALDLAVRGKLVPQRTKDESPEPALLDARRWLASEAAHAKRLRWKPSTSISHDEIEKELPQGWIAARINDTGLYINGLAFKPNEWKKTGLPIIRIQNLTDPLKEFNFAEGDFPDEVIVRNGDILVSWSATLDAFQWNRDTAVLNQHIFRVIPAEQLTCKAFLLLLLRNAIREMAESEHAHGLVMSHINREPFMEHVVFIPPIAEQHRIVAKFDELMALCDRLEASLTMRDSARRQLLDALLNEALAPSDDQQEEAA